MVVSLQRRYLKVVISLQTGTFNQNGRNYNTVTIDGKSGFKIWCQLDVIGGFYNANCKLRMFGLSKDTMDAIFCVNQYAVVKNMNTVTVYASDDDENYNVVFAGLIMQSMPEFNGDGEVPCVIEAITGLDAALGAPTPDSYKGAVLISEMASKIAATLNLSLENNGVSGYLTDEYLPGSTMDKLKKLSKDGHFDYYITADNKTLAICPFNKPRGITQVELNKSTGLVGWPIKNVRGVTFTSLFNSDLVPGRPIKITSEYQAQCNGVWYIYSAQYMLACNDPDNDSWFVHAMASPNNYQVSA